MKHHPPKKASHSVKQDISSAADQIPHLIFRSIRDEEAAPIEDAPRVSSSAIRTYQLRKKDQDYAKKRLLAVGVVCITLVIIAMWAWNMRVFWYKTQEITKDEPALWDASKDDLSSILKSATAQKQAIDELLKTVDNAKDKKENEALENAFKSLLATTPTSTTSTVTTTTTSTPVGAMTTPSTTTKTTSTTPATSTNQ